MSFSFQGLEVSKIRSLSIRPASTNAWPVATLMTIDAIWPPPSAAAIIVETCHRIPEPVRALTGQAGLLTLTVRDFGVLLLVRLRISDKQLLVFEYEP